MSITSSKCKLAYCYEATKKKPEENQKPQQNFICSKQIKQPPLPFSLLNFSSFFLLSISQNIDIHWLYGTPRAPAELSEGKERPPYSPASASVTTLFTIN